MDDITLACLGDKEAWERVTERGELLPCWRCGGVAEIKEVHIGSTPLYKVSCKKHFCGAYGCAHRTKAEAVEYWNTRPALLSPEKIKRLEAEDE